MTKLPFRLSVMLCAFLLPVLCTGFARADEVRFHSTSQTRMYAATHEEAYNALHEALEEIGLRPGERDRKSGLIQTRSTRCGARGKLDLELEPPESPDGRTSYDCHRIVVYAFVSPFVEPARVHVASRAAFRADRVPSVVVRDHDEALGEFVLDALDRKLGQPGYPTPVDHVARHELARRLVRSRGDELPECLVREAGFVEKLPGNAEERPTSLLGFSPELAYPELERRKYREGKVFINGVVQEDGVFVPLRILKDTTEGTQLSLHAVQHTRFRRFEPLTVDGCPLTSGFTQLVRFTLERRR